MSPFTQRNDPLEIKHLAHSGQVVFGIKSHFLTRQPFTYAHCRYHETTHRVF